MHPDIRAARPDDAPGIAAIYDPLVVDTCISFEAEPVGASGMEERIRSVTARLPWLVSAEGPSIAGYAYASPHRQRAAYRWAVETSIFVHPDHQGRGVARALYTTLLSELTALGYTTAWAGVTLPNAASVALHARFGFTPVGVFEAVGFKHGRWHDVGWYRLPLGPLDGSPAEPAVWDPQRPLASSA
ncbi:MAG: arsinothricin resistance N-acetyltransferase ArsN1 family B [Myxococcota bacterium]